MESLPTSPASSDQASDDRAGREYWERWWERNPLPPPMEPYRRGLKNYPFRKLHEFFELVFKGHPTRGRKLIEIGCAQSAFLPYFAKYFGFDVYGLDRSEIGCERACKMLERQNVVGHIHCGDFFSPPRDLLGRLDVLVSFGVVEHFENTAACVRAMSRLLAPQGTIITEIPNLVGLPGALQKILDRAIYDAHVPLDRESLGSAHRDAGLEVESCEYFLPISLEVLRPDRWPKGMAYAINRLHGAISRAVWLAEEHLRIPTPNRWTSPYINCVARKPGAEPFHASHLVEE